MSTTEPTAHRTVLAQVPIANPAARMEALFAMSPAERTAIARRGELTYVEACRWAARFPEEVDLIDGEFWFIAQRTPEVCEAE